MKNWINLFSILNRDSRMPEEEKEITVEQLLEKRPGFRFYRLLNKEENHRGFQYKTGLNIDTNEFNPSGSCEKGGLYFFDEAQLINYSRYTRKLCLD